MSCAAGKCRVISLKNTAEAVGQHPLLGHRLEQLKCHNPRKLDCFCGAIREDLRGVRKYSRKTSLKNWRDCRESFAVFRLPDTARYVPGLRGTTLVLADRYSLKLEAFKFWPTSKPLTWNSSSARAYLELEGIHVVHSLDHADDLCFPLWSPGRRGSGCQGHHDRRWRIPRFQGLNPVRAAR